MRGRSPPPPTAVSEEPEKRVRKSGYRPWAELLKRAYLSDTVGAAAFEAESRAAYELSQNEAATAAQNAKADLQRQQTAADARQVRKESYLRVPVAALFENLEDEASIQDFVEWFPGVSLHQARAILEHAARSASAA